MSVFDLLFILLFLTAVVTLIAAAWCAVRGDFQLAGVLLGRLAAGAAVYMAVVIGVSCFGTRRVLGLKAPQCFDDWCVAIDGVDRAVAGSEARYDVAVRVFSRAKRISQREKNLVVYLTDDRGVRYDPVADRAARGFDVLLGPGESAVVHREFVTPASAQGIGVVAAHEGGFPIGHLIIGYDTWFKKPPLIRFE